MRLLLLVGGGVVVMAGGVMEVARAGVAGIVAVAAGVAAEGAVSEGEGEGTAVVAAAVKAAPVKAFDDEPAATYAVPQPEVTADARASGVWCALRAPGGARESGARPRA